MQRFVQVTLVAALTALFVISSAESADLSKGDRSIVPIRVAQAEKPDETDSKPAPRTFRGRLPNNYGKLGVTSKQREDIYKIQATYNEQIEELEKQIADLKAKRDEEVYNVLTDAQKTKLKEILEEKEAAKKTAADSK